MLPHNRCNYITSSVLIGARPNEEAVKKLLNLPVTLFINLDVDKASYTHLLPKHVKLIHFPIRPSGVPKKKQVWPLLQTIRNETQNNNGTIYMHCVGGHGRAGTIASILCGLEYNMKTSEAIRYVQKQREKRIDKSRNFVPIPESNLQIKFIAKFLGVDENDPLPSRSDKKWLKRVKKERREKKKKI